MKNRLCLILCTLTMLGFVMVFVQQQWKPFKTKPLQGFTPTVEKPELTLDHFTSGDYQNQVEHYISDNFGFREFFIRVYNQLVYSCFRKINNENVKEGANHELYLKMYLEDITGKRLRWFYPDVESAKAAARDHVAATLTLIDSLHRHGTEFLFVFAPSKTALYPELMPKEYQRQMSDFSLEEYYIQLFKENGIPHIDFLDYFRSLKGNFPYPLYTRTGTHWSEATIPMVADSIYRKMEEVAHCKLPSINYIDPNCTKNYSIQDGELESSMNLLFPLRKPAVPRPVFALSDTLGTDKPNLLVIADSYFVQLMFSCFVDAFNHWDFWRYNRDIESSNPKYKGKEVSKLPEAQRVLEEADIVLAMFTAPTLCKYMYGFAESALRIYEYGSPLTEEELVQQIVERIKNDQHWFQLVEDQAKERGISLEENLVKNAKYVIAQEKKKKKQ